MNQISLRLTICGILLALLLATCSAPPPTASTPTPMPAGLSGMVSGKVDVGGYELYYKCIGQGSPTVILEAGGPDDSSDWELVMVYFGTTTRICAYDRANLGLSDKAPKPRTYLDMTRDLHALLLNAPIKGPYVLVGHSMGGMLVRLFADQYPEETAGIVLVDSAHPDMGTRLLAVLPPKATGEPESLEAWRQYGIWMSTSDGRAPDDVEGVDAQVSNEQIRAVKSLGDLPLVVISRSPNNPVMADAMPSLPEETNARLMQLWQEMQEELAGLSSHGIRVVADHSGHNVMLEEPRLVVKAIRQLVDDYRVQTGESIPPDLSETEAASHRPVILSITERKEQQNGDLSIYKDISFSDPAGDAITAVNKVVSFSGRGAAVYDDIIRASSAEQKRGAVVSSGFGCFREFEIVIEYRIFDAAGNMSEPETVTFSCPAPKPDISPFLIIGLVAGIGLLAITAWMLVRHRRSRVVPVSQQ